MTLWSTFLVLASTSWSGWGTSFCFFPSGDSASFPLHFYIRKTHVTLCLPTGRTGVLLAHLLPVLVQPLDHHQLSKKSRSETIALRSCVRGLWFLHRHWLLFTHKDLFLSDTSAFRESESLLTPQIKFLSNPVGCWFFFFYPLESSGVHLVQLLPVLGQPLDHLQLSETNISETIALWSCIRGL